MESNNVDGICHYHPIPSFGGPRSCCGSNVPCKRSRHRDIHHCDFPYAAFFEMARAINNYTDTVKLWGICQDKNLDDPSLDPQFVKVGKLLKWRTGTQPLTDNLLFVQVGTLVATKPYWLHFYTEKELDQIGREGKTDIFRTSESESSYSMAKWVILDQQVVGIHIEAKALTSEVPTVKIISFVPFPLTFGKIQTFSAGGLVEAKPEGKYTFPAPETMKVGPVINDQLVRPRRTFQSFGYPLLRIILKDTFEANHLSSRSHDNWTGTFSLINLMKGDNKEPIIIVNARCEWRYVGNPEWQEVDHFDMERSFTCFPMENTDVPFRIDQKAPGKNVTLFGRAYLTRKQPIRFRVTFEDVFGDYAAIVFEDVYKPQKLEALNQNPEDAVDVFVDNIDTYERYKFGARALHNDSYHNYLSVDLIGDYNDIALRSLVYKAIQNQQTEVLLGEINDEPQKGFHVNKKAWALIDLSCLRVYAVKVLIMGVNDTSVAGHMGYLPIDLYGKTDVVKPNQPAHEDVTVDFMRDLEQEVGPDPEVLPQDDNFDDVAPEYVRPPNPLFQQQGPLNPTQLALQGVADNVSRMASAFDRLTNVANSLERIAQSTAQVAEIFTR